MSRSRRASSPPQASSPICVFAQSNAAVIQQLAAGSINVSTNSGLVDPIRAIEKGAPLAIIRIEVQVPPYSLLAKPSIKSMKDLKGKLISVGGAKDITRIFVEQMLEPNGVKPGEFDMTFAGATSARFSALQAGAVDAAILTPPFNFHAQSAGFTLLGHTVEYVDMPFAGIAREHQLGRRQQGHGGKADRGLQQEHGLALRSQEPRRSGADPDEGQQDQEGGRREGLRLPASAENTSSRPARSRGRG